MHDIMMFMETNENIFIMLNYFQIEQKLDDTDIIKTKSTVLDFFGVDSNKIKM